MRTERGTERGRERYVGANSGFLQFCEGAPSFPVSSADSDGRQCLFVCSLEAVRH
jgi:hypothetical protein